METPNPSPRGQPPPLKTALTAIVLIALVLVGGLWLRSLRSSGNPATLPANHVALSWSDWVFLLPPAPGEKPDVLAPADPDDLGRVTLENADFGLLSVFKSMRRDTDVIRPVPSPFAPGQPPTVAGFWEPLAKRRAEAGEERPLVVLLRAPIYLSPFQTALAWSDPGGRLIVVDLSKLGSDSEEIATRAAKLLRHEYGHLAGCVHDDGCVMSPASDVAQLDALSNDYCGPCVDQVGEFPYTVPEYGPVIRRVDPVTGARLPDSGE